MKTTTIEDLVRWAYLEELPKVAPPRGGRIAPAMLGMASAWAATVGLARMRSSGSINVHGVVWDPEAEGEPDPVALAVAAAVSDLDGAIVEELADSDFFGAWGDLGRLGEAALDRAWDRVVYVEPVDGGGHLRRLRGSASMTVVVASVTGVWPDWRGNVPIVVQVLGPNGRPKWVRRVERAVRWDNDGNPVAFDTIEADGMDRRRGRPYPDAYREEALSPDPTAVLADRIRWAMLHAWFSRLATALDGIGGRRVSPPDVPASPWL